MEWYYPLVAWAAVLGSTVRGLQVLYGDRGPRWLPAAFGMLAWIPIEGLPLARWLHGYSSNLSVPLTVILLNSTLSPLWSRPWLDATALQTAVWWGAVAGVFLYPLAGGIGPFDPYVLGWNRLGIEVVVAAISAILLWRGNRFGWVLILTGVAWRLGCLESENIWDSLIDPVYFVVSLIGLAMTSRNRSGGHNSTVPVEVSGGSVVPRP